MKTVRSLTLLAFAATTLAGSAAVMNITVDADGNYLQNGLPPIGENSLASVAFYKSFNGGSQNNSPTANFNLLQGVLANWNAKNAPILPTAIFTTEPNNAESIEGNSYTTLANYDYVVFHFGNGQAGGGPDDEENGWWSVWYLGGESKEFNAVPQEGNPLQNIGGFSSARYFNGTNTPPNDDPDPDPRTVPDGGTTIASLGLALLGLGGLRRLIKKA